MIGTACVNSIERDTRSWADVAKLEIETQKKEPLNLWVRCGYISRTLCRDWEVHPWGKVRWWESKVIIPGRADIGGYLVTYRNVGPKKHRRAKTFSMHRISLETFYPKPHPTLECDHRDETRTNYDIRNLRWVSHPLNIAFQRHRGIQRMWLKGEQCWKYRARFRSTCYPYRYNKEAARREYLYVRAVWIWEERQRIIQLVMAHNGVDRLEAIRMLNWDKRDDVFFLVELNE